MFSCLGSRRQHRLARSFWQREHEYAANETRDTKNKRRRPGDGVVETQNKWRNYATQSSRH